MRVDMVSVSLCSGTLCSGIEVDGLRLDIGFEAVLAGAHQRLDEDDALLAEMSKMLDSLYAYFQQAGGRPG